MFMHHARQEILQDVNRLVKQRPGQRPHVCCHIIGPCHHLFKDGGAVVAIGAMDCGRHKGSFQTTEPDTDNGIPVTNPLKDWMPTGEGGLISSG